MVEREKVAGKQARVRESSVTRVPPHSLEAEQSVLGAMIIQPSTIPVVAEILSGKDFYRDTNGNMYDEILTMWSEDSGSVDQVTLGQRFPEHTEFIHAIVEMCPVAANAKYYADIVKRASISRQLITAGQEITELGYDTEEEESKLLDGAESRLSHLRPNLSRNVYRIGSLGRSVIESIESGESPPMVSTGFASIDEYAQGLHEGNFIVVGARPGVGKTCLGLAVAQRVSRTGEVLFFSLEMSAEELMERLLASIACVSLTKMRERRLQPDELANLYRAQEELESCDLRFVDDPSMSVMSLKSKARQHAKRFPLKLIVVDYLQLMSLGMRAESRREEVSMMSRQLKSLARELSVPIMALSQLNRVSTFDGSGVDISQLKESGSLEQDADQVWLMDWPKKQEFGTKSVVVKIAKNRHGPLGDVDLVWLPQYQRYEE